MQIAQSSELYPVGTDIVGLYIGRDASNYALFTAGLGIDTDGSVTEMSQWATSEIFMPINPSYRYQKSGNRMYLMTWYDQDYNLLERWATNSQTYNNLTVKEITGIPSNARYFRFCESAPANSNWRIAVTRIE